MEKHNNCVLKAIRQKLSQQKFMKLKEPIDSSYIYEPEYDPEMINKFTKEHETIQTRLLLIKIILLQFFYQINFYFILVAFYPIKFWMSIQIGLIGWN